jgi:hypothetical protein
MQVLELAQCEDRATRERHRSRPEWHGQDACRTRSRLGRMPEGHVRRLHHGRRPDQRDDGGT